MMTSKVMKMFAWGARDVESTPFADGAHAHAHAHAHEHAHAHAHEHAHAHAHAHVHAHARTLEVDRAPLVGARGDSPGADGVMRFDKVEGRRLILSPARLWHFAATPGLVLAGMPGDRPWLNALLPLVPLAFVAEARGWGSQVVFPLALVSMIPLAERLGFATENVAEYLGDTIGGLMNATMGNAPELIICLFALKDNLLRVVQLSLLGSVLSNLLLVLGTAFFLGGLRFKEQVFNNRVTQVNAALLLLAVMGLLLPAVLTASNTEANPGQSALLLSRLVALLMLIVYGCFLVFQLRTHSHLFDGHVEDEEPGAAAPAVPASAVPASVVRPEDGMLVTDHGSVTGSRSGEEDEEDDRPVLTLYEAFFWLAAISGVIAALSEVLVGSIEGAAEAAHIPDLFISCILLPIAGNAAEHASAVIFAMRNRLDLAIGIAIGSATQIAMFVLPLCIVVAWIRNKPLTLDFKIFETAVFFITALVVTQITTNGTRTHYLMGIGLIAAYVALAIAFLVHSNDA